MNRHRRNPRRIEVLADSPLFAARHSRSANRRRVVQDVAQSWESVFSRAASAV